MKAFLGSIKRQIGEAFVTEVKTWLESNTHCQIRSEIPINPNTFLKADSDLGDIDLLLLDCTKQAVYSIECKALNYGRNTREMASELERLLEEKDDQDSWIDKHIRRDHWLSNNVSKLSSLFKMELTGYKLSSLFLTSEEIPAPYLREMPLPFVSFPRLRRKGLEALAF